MVHFAIRILTPVLASLSLDPVCKVYNLQYIPFYHSYSRLQSTAIHWKTSPGKTDHKNMAHFVIHTLTTFSPGGWEPFAKHRDLLSARGTLIVPLWKSSASWNVCSTEGVHSNNFIIDCIFLTYNSQGNYFFKGGGHNYSLFWSPASRLWYLYLFLLLWHPCLANRFLGNFNYSPPARVKSRHKINIYNLFQTDIFYLLI